MALAMARPIQLRPGGPWHLKERPPADLKAKVKGLLVSLPVADTTITVKVGEFVQASLRTKDEREAKARHAVADAALRNLWAAHRAGPKHLSQREIVGLTGEFYRSVVAKHEDDPGKAQGWLKAEADSLLARTSRFDPNDKLRLAISAPLQSERMAKLFADPVAELLDRKGLVIDSDSREALLREIAKAFEQAARQLRSHAEGDYRPDPDAERFPKWVQPAQPEAAKGRADGLTLEKLTGLFLEARKVALKPDTLKRYRPALRSLAEFTGRREADAVTSDDIFAWACQRRDKDEVSARSINRNDLYAAKAMFTWALSREGGRRVLANPVTNDTRLDEERKQARREKAFRPDEISALLRAATAVEIDPANPTLTFAYRWCPWLAAYSGARIAELTGLLASDIREEAGIVIMDFRETKTDAFRSVPIHDHVLEQGFFDFAREREGQALFIDPARRRVGSETLPEKVRSGQMCRWIRGAVDLSEDLQPNHGWRHTFKSRALEAGIPETISDTITGHALTRVGRSYEHKTVRQLSASLSLFPRYEL